MTQFGKSLVWVCVALLAIGFSFVLYPREKPWLPIEAEVIEGPLFENPKSDESSIVPDEVKSTSTPYVMTGYYTQYERINMYDGEFYGTSTCDAFTATKNDNPLTEYLADLIRRQNTINSFTSEGYIRININIKNITSATREKIINSSATNTIQIIMSKRKTEGKDGVPCGSFVTILEK